MTIEKCPCEECISLAICRHKVYGKMFSECSIIKAYIPNHSIESERNPYRVTQLEKALKPTRWTYDYCRDLNPVYKMILNKKTMRPRFGPNAYNEE